MENDETKKCGRWSFVHCVVWKNSLWAGVVCAQLGGKKEVEGMEYCLKICRGLHNGQTTSDSSSGETF